MNPRYLAFCRAHRIPVDVRINGENCLGASFICWVRSRWVEWDRLTNHGDGPHSPADHAAFDAWLTASVEAQEGALEVAT